jgi:hypothetical protein
VYNVYTISEVSHSYCFFFVRKSIVSVMVSVLASSAVDHAFELRSGKSKNWVARNQNNVSEWSDMSTRELLFQ